MEENTTPNEITLSEADSDGGNAALNIVGQAVVGAIIGYVGVRTVRFIASIPYRRELHRQRMISQERINDIRDNPRSS
jgi:hypothetical protein